MWLTFNPMGLPAQLMNGSRPFGLNAELKPPLQPTCLSYMPSSSATVANAMDANGSSSTAASDATAMPSRYCWTLNGIQSGQQDDADDVTPLLFPGGRAKAGSKGAYMEKVPLGAIVDVAFINPGGMAHPMHLHGHEFWVLGSGTAPLDQILGEDGKILYTALNLEDPIKVDTHAVPEGGMGMGGMGGGMGAMGSGMGEGGGVPVMGPGTGRRRQRDEQLALATAWEEKKKDSFRLGTYFQSLCVKAVESCLLLACMHCCLLRRSLQSCSMPGREPNPRKRRRLSAKKNGPSARWRS